MPNRLVIIAAFLLVPGLFAPGLLALVTLVSPGVPAAADFVDGMEAYARKDYAAAREEFAALAEAGDLRAQYALGMLYLEGQGVEADPVEARLWFERAAERGHMSAHVRLGQLLADEAGDGDLIRAYMWFTIAAAQGHPSGEMLRSGLAERMDEAALAEARAEAEAWMAAHVDVIDKNRLANFLSELKKLRSMVERQKNGAR